MELGGGGNGLLGTCKRLGFSLVGLGRDTETSCCGVTQAEETSLLSEVRL